MRQDSRDFFLSLLDAAGPSGDERAPARIWRDYASGFASVETDALGSSHATVNSAGERTVVVMGHIDEIGLAITHVDDEGYLWFDGVGGWTPSVLVGQRIRILAKERPDRRRHRQEGDAPPRRGGPQEADQARPALDRHRRDRRRRRPRARPARRPRRHRAAGRRARQRPPGVARDGQPHRGVRRRRGGPPLRRDARVVALRRRRVGRRGDQLRRRPHELVLARAPGRDRHRRHPHIRLPERHEEQDRRHQDRRRAGDRARVRRPPGVRRDGGRGRGRRGHPAPVRRGRRAARGPTPTPCHRSRGGVATCLVSVPNRYMHSPNEVIELADLEATARLVAAVARNLDAVPTSV